MADLGAHKALLAERFASQVRGYARIVGDVEDKRLGVVSLDFSPMDNAQVAYALEERFGIMIRTGLHCAPLAHQSLGSYPQGTVRFSFGAWNTLEEADVCAEAVREILRG